MANKSDWFNHAYRRNVIDMHIPQWDDRFLTEFNAEKYIGMLEKIGAQSAVIYAQSHVGLCNWPTKSGEFHKGFGGKDMFRDMSELCKEKGIKVVAYYSLIYNNWAVEHYPAWGMILSDGRPSHYGGRYKHACANNQDYRAFVCEQIRELCDGYHIDGIRFDMTFWPCVCYCDSCRKRYSKETRHDNIPEIVDWGDPVWVEFQNKREEWLLDFAGMATGEVRKLAPHASVEHQIGPIVSPWRFGVTSEIRNYVDFMQADFYGDEIQTMFVNKFLYNITPNPMYGFETSSNISLEDHTSIKPKELLETKLRVSMANGGAFVFIDAIDPVGTINERVYDVMENVFRESSVYDKYRGGKMLQDVGIYFSTNSKIDFNQNRTHVREYDIGGDNTGNLQKMPHMDAVLGAMTTMSQNHIPFGILSKAQLEALSSYKVIILPDLLMMDEAEINAFRKYVWDGGILYASKLTSLITKDGIHHKNYVLSDVFGVDYLGMTASDYTYISPTADGNKMRLFDGVDDKYPLTIRSSQTRVIAKPGAKVLATTVLPYTNTNDCTIFGSIHSHPPGIPTREPALVMNNYGKGKAYYSTADMEVYSHASKHFAGLIKYICEKPMVFKSCAHPVIDMTLFEKEENGVLTMNFVTYQKILPNLPINDVNAEIFTMGRDVESIKMLPDESVLDFNVNGYYASFTIPKIDTFAMVQITLK